MSLQPGPQDPNDESALTPPAPPEQAPEPSSPPLPSTAESPAASPGPGRRVARDDSGSPGRRVARDDFCTCCAPAHRLGGAAAGPCADRVPRCAARSGRALGGPADGGRIGLRPAPSGRRLGLATSARTRLRLRPTSAGELRRPAAQLPAGRVPPQGYQAVGYPTARQTDSKAVIGLVLAISSWLVCPLITAIIALVLAGQSNRAIAASGGRLEGRSMNTATKVIAWINIVLSILALIAMVGLIIFAATTDSSVFTEITDSSTQF